MLKSEYNNEINNLCNWINNIVNNNIDQFKIPRCQQEVIFVQNNIKIVSKSIANEYPMYSKELESISRRLFFYNIQILNIIYLNAIAFGELLAIIRCIKKETILQDFWSEIHPCIINVVYKLFAEGFYSAAAEKAVKEIETRLKKKFSELKPGVPVPSKVVDIINSLLSDKGIFQYIDCSNNSGKDFRRGIKLLFEGTIAAYRNPAAHANIECSKRESMEQIMLASQLIYVLDKPNIV